MVVSVMCLYSDPVDNLWCEGLLCLLGAMSGRTATDVPYIRHSEAHVILIPDKVRQGLAQDVKFLLA
jgi:hypothetical protein